MKLKFSDTRPQYIYTGSLNNNPPFPPKISLFVVGAYSFSELLGFCVERKKIELRAKSLNKEGGLLDDPMYTALFPKRHGKRKILYQEIHNLKTCVVNVQNSVLECLYDFWLEFYVNFNLSENGQKRMWGCRKKSQIPISW